MLLEALFGNGRASKAGRASAGCEGQAALAGAWRRKGFSVHVYLCAVTAGGGEAGNYSQTKPDLELLSSRVEEKNLNPSTFLSNLPLVLHRAGVNGASGVQCMWFSCGPCMPTHPSTPPLQAVLEKRGEAWGSPLQCISYSSSSSLPMNRLAGCCFRQSMAEYIPISVQFFLKALSTKHS